MGLSLPKIVAVMILSLATWSLFYIVFGERLSDSETVLVVAAWAVVVFMGIWIWNRLRRSRDINEAKS